jgi:serine/threonine protein kinase/Tol biopolymer transport system component
LPLTPGTRLGVYAITTQIGAGGMGEVYRATDGNLKRSVAIKVLPTSVAGDADRLARFQREAEILASLNHPNIAAIYGVEHRGDVHALVLELVEGQTLAEKLASQRPKGIRFDEALAIARQIADALDAAHERGIVHRDLKPANIALSPEGVVKVLDFGLAIPGAGAESGELTNSPTMMAPTVEGMLLGTAPYMSPEQARGKAVDKRTDIWAFGCVLYEMLTGRRAFDGETSSDAIAAILEREPDYSRLNASTPPHIVRLLERMLDKDLKTRLRDIGDARAELSSDYRPATSNSRASSAKRTGERLMWSALVAAAAGAAALAVMSLRTAPPLASAVMFDAPFPPGLAPTFAQLAISPDGHTLAVAPTFEGRAPIWLRPIDSSAGRILPGTEGATFPFWSPDGKSIGFFAERKLKRIEIDGEAVTILTDVQVPRGGMWQPDGTIVFAPNAVGPLFRVPSSGGTAVAATKLEPGQNDHRAPFLLPDSRHFLYYSRGTAQVRGVYVARLDGSESRRLADADAAAVYASGHLLFVRQNELLAQPFDADRLSLSGAAVRVAAPVAVSPAISLASLAASPAGAIAYAASSVQSGQFVWVNRAGAKIEALGQPEQTPIAMASLSPDGRRIAFSRAVGGNWDIWLMDMHGTMSRFTSDPALDMFPIWSADGRQIFFQSPRVQGPAPNLYVRSVGDGTPEELLLKSDWPKSPSAVSADGRVLLYTVNNSGVSSEIWSLPLTGDRTPRVFVKSSSFHARDGEFSPDGRWVAYQSDESGRNEIYLQPFPGPGEHIQLSPGGGTQVRWGQRSAEVFYIAADQRLNAVPVRIAANGALSLGSPKPLFQVSAIRSLGLQYVVSADGQRFLLNTQTADPPSITMILNWKGQP